MRRLTCWWKTLIQGHKKTVVFNIRFHKAKGTQGAVGAASAAWTEWRSAGRWQRGAGKAGMMFLSQGLLRKGREENERRKVEVVRRSWLSIGGSNQEVRNGTNVCWHCDDSHQYQ